MGRGTCPLPLSKVEEPGAGKSSLRKAPRRSVAFSGLKPLWGGCALPLAGRPGMSAD